MLLFGRGAFIQKAEEVVDGVDAVLFDGSNDSGLWDSGISGLSDGKQGTVSIWFYLNADAEHTIFVTWPDVGTNSGIWWRIRAAGPDFQVLSKNAAGITIHNHIGTNTNLTIGEWHHGICSWDLATGTSIMYVDDVEEAAPSTVVDDTIDYTKDRAAIASIDGIPFFDGEMSELYFTTEFIDISVEANRRKFITSDGKPADLGADGSTPTGNQPIVYISGDASVWNDGTNLGSGGDFVMSGAVTDSNNEPVTI